MPEAEKTKVRYVTSSKKQSSPSHLLQHYTSHTQPEYPTMASTHPRTTLRADSPSTATATRPANSGSQIITQPSTLRSNPNPTLRLRGHHDAAQPTSSNSRRHIQWDSSVVDNEGMGKKSSKVCCIYHKPHEPGDSDSDTSSSSDSDSDGEVDLSRAQRAGGGGKGRGRKGKHDGGEGGEGGKGRERKASPNAYERQPKAKGKRKEEG